MTTNDSMTICLKCGSQICYTNIIEDIKNYLCLSCGFTSNSKFNDPEYLKLSEEGLPELYKDLKYIDPEGGIWYPSTINFPEKGIIFANGTNKDEWKWAGVLAVKVKEEEKDKFKIPGTENKYYSHRIDMDTLKLFEQDEFTAACDYVGVLALDETLDNN